MNEISIKIVAYEGPPRFQNLHKYNKTVSSFTTFYGSRSLRSFHLLNNGAPSKLIFGISLV